LETLARRLSFGTRNEQKWLDGLDWSQIDAGRASHPSASGEEIGLDLKDFHDGDGGTESAAVNSDGGQIVVYEPLGIPYPTNEYHVRSKADSDQTYRDHAEHKITFSLANLSLSERPTVDGAKARQPS
jgi:hypothetical protein